MPKSDQEPPRSTTNWAPPQPLRQRGHTPHPSSATKKYSALRGNVLQCYEAPLASPSYGLQPHTTLCAGVHPAGAPTRMTCTRLPIRHFSLMRCRPGINISERRGCGLHMGRLNAWCPAGQNALPPAMREALHTRAAGSWQQPSRKVEGTWCAQTSALQMRPGRR